MQALYSRRLFVNRFNLVMSLMTMAFGLAFLFWILFTLFAAGFHAFSVNLFTQMTPPPGSNGGLLNAIFGSVFMAAMGTLLGTPIGIFAGIYLAEYGSRGWLASCTRFINDILLSAPSIVIGLFIYEIYVFQVGHFSAWAGSLALALIVIPVVVRTTENMLRLVPDSLREAAIALGTPQWRVIVMVTLRSVRAGVITGILLAVARISGPVVIFQFAMSPYKDWQELAWAGALLITLAVLILNILARVFFRQAAPK